jgi:hypothetical protein
VEGTISGAVAWPTGSPSMRACTLIDLATVKRGRRSWAGGGRLPRLIAVAQDLIGGPEQCELEPSDQLARFGGRLATCCVKTAMAAAARSLPTSTWRCR